MKWLKRLALAIPAVLGGLLVLFVLIEAVGAGVNHYATKVQTDQLRDRLEEQVEDVVIMEVDSQTGNTSGTGNHVDCLSRITFRSAFSKDELMERLEEYYEFDPWYCSITEAEDGCYVFGLLTSAPFPNNIEGH